MSQKPVSLNPDDLVHTDDRLFLVSEGTLRTMILLGRQESVDSVIESLTQDNFATGAVMDTEELGKIDLLKPPF